MNPPEAGPFSFERLASFENLYRASMAARKGKRFLSAAGRFHHRLAENLLHLRDELLSGRYRPGEYHTFEIFEPAHRYISAAPYRDRVVHHALCAVIQPLFERSFIRDSYANQMGKGTHAALDRCTESARQYRFVFQGDIRKFFPSIDFTILEARLARRIFDPRVMELCRTILHHSNPQEAANFYFPGDDLFTPFERRRGLPIGNLTSQFWANVYLDPLDHYFRDELGVPAYVRYVDDLLVFSNSKDDLQIWRELATARLDGMRLMWHPRKCRIYPVTEGIPFLGFRVFRGHRLLLAPAVKRARKRLERLTSDYEAGAIPMERVRASIDAWQAHAAHGDTMGLRRSLLGAAAFRAGGRIARRVLEQQS